MGAFETFVNANLGIRKPLITDTGPPSGSQKAAGIIGSEYLDSDTNYLYERTGESNNEFDWVFTRKLGDSLIDFSSGISEDFSSDLSIISGNLNSTGQNLENQINQLSENLGSSQTGISISDQILQISGDLDALSSQTISSRVDVFSGDENISIRYEDLGSTSVFDGAPNVLVTLNSKSTTPPVSYYSYMPYGISSTGFHVSFSSAIEEQDLFLDVMAKGDILSEETAYAEILNSQEILSRTGDPEGSVFFGQEDDNIYIFDGTIWHIFESS